MELQTKDNRSYTNQLPKWAIGCHIGLISVFLFIGICGLGLSFSEFSEMGLGFSILLFAIGVTFVGFAWFSYKNLRNYLDIVIHIQLGDKGYDSYVKDKLKGEEQHIFLPYEKMKYVLIGMDYRLNAKSKIAHSDNYQLRTKFSKVRSAKLFIYGVDSTNQIRVTSFPHAEKQSLYDWIDVFLKHKVDIFHTDQALTATPSVPEIIESIPKEQFDGKLSFVIGSEAENTDTFFLTDEQKESLHTQSKKKLRL